MPSVRVHARPVPETPHRTPGPDARLPVKAFMKVDSDRFNILKNGSRHGYFCEPHRTVCSRMWGTPVLSMGVVRNCTLRPGGAAAG